MLLHLLPWYALLEPMVIRDHWSGLAEERWLMFCFSRQEYGRRLSVEYARTTTRSLMTVPRSWTQ